MAKKKNSIFVQIASYRDPELKNTIRDLLDNADNPQNLHIGIVWQHSPYEDFDNISEYSTDPRFEITDMDYRDAKGPCYARYLLNKMYKGEKYTLQLDSHHRFIQGWDTTLINMVESLRSPECKKPLLSAYLPSFDPANDPASRTGAPWIMEFDRFAPEGPVHFLPRTIDNWKELTSPMPSRFISGHFIFTDGKFCKEVEYDPTYYFHGEEINLSVRAYMAGYDLFAPHIPVIWHEYIRNDKKKHWDDHLNWNALDRESHKHNRELFGIDGESSDTKLKNNTKIVRTLAQYEMYAGLEFSTRRVHKNTLDKQLPALITDTDSHKAGLTSYHKMCIDIHRPALNETDYNFWAVAFEDKHGKEIYRQDADANEIKQLLSVPMETDNFVHVWRNFYTDERPARWIVWPQSESKGWMDRLTGEFQT